jgi:hypothetical protein
MQCNFQGRRAFHPHEKPRFKLAPPGGTLLLGNSSLKRSVKASIGAFKILIRSSMAPVHPLDEETPPACLAERLRIEAGAWLRLLRRTAG